MEMNQSKREESSFNSRESISLIKRVEMNTMDATINGKAK